MSDVNIQTFSGKVNVSNNFTVGSGHLFVDTQNNKVGLNTTTPEANLHVTGNTTPHTIEFQNTDTSLVVSGNVEVGGELIMTGTCALTVPNGTTLQRPSITNVGMIRFNTYKDTLEQHTSSSEVDRTPLCKKITSPPSKRCRQTKRLS